MQQLVFASSRGIRIPRTNITNQEDCAQDFASENESGTITKAIYTANVDIEGVNAAIPTQRVDENVSQPFRQVSLCPTKLQAEIKKSYEVRVTVVADRVFAAKIDSQNDERTEVDWRPFAHLCRHEEIVLPREISVFCVDLLKKFSLNYGAIDFIVDSDENYVFLEINPFGQYLWIENETGLPITRAIFDQLTKVQAT
nr:hypothetical protein [Ruegeria sp. HKCCD6604]